MNIVQTIPSISEEASGPSYSVTGLCKALIANGEAVTLAALNGKSMSSPPPFLMTFKPGIGPRRLGRSPELKRWLTGKAAAGEVDVIHNHSLWMMPNVYPGQIARRFRIPYVVSPRGTFSEYALSIGSRVKLLFWPLLQKPSLVATTCFHATAESEYADIRRMGFRQPVAIIPNGIDIPEGVPKRSANERVLLFLGRVHPNKGLSVLIRAWKELQVRFPDWRLKIVGPDEGGYLGDVRRLAENISARRVDFSGPLYGREKTAAYLSSELFVLPSHSENFGMAVAESLAAGCPAIVSKGAPWGGLIAKKAGWWIEQGVEPLVACLEKAMGMPQAALSEMGCRGREWMRTEYSWEFVGRRMSETYRWVNAGAAAVACPSWIRIQ